MTYIAYRKKETIQYNIMIKLLKAMSYLFSAMALMFSPIQNLTQANGMCCAECAMKKEDEIEIVSEVEDVTNVEA